MMENTFPQPVSGKSPRNGCHTGKFGNRDCPIRSGRTGLSGGRIPGPPTNTVPVFGPSMSQQFRVAQTSEIPPGEGRSFEVNDCIVAIFHIDGQFYAINDACPHMGASLSVGHLEGCVVSCPLHAWRFDVRDGTWRDNPRVKTDSYPLTIDGDDILIRMDD